MNSLPFRRALLLAAAVSVLAGRLSADPVVLVLSPTGDLSGAPGATVGWGWSIQNNTPYYLEFSSSQFCDSPVTLTPLICNGPTTGTFNDIIVGNDPIIAPNTTTPVENFDAVGFTTGLGYFQIDPAANPGDSDLGDIVLVYDGYTGDPTTCSPCTQELFSVPVAAEASITVSSVSTPEPSGAWMLPVALAAVLSLGLRRRRRALIAARS